MSEYGIQELQNKRQCNLSFKQGQQHGVDREDTIPTQYSRMNTLYC